MNGAEQMKKLFWERYDWFKTVIIAFFIVTLVRQYVFKPLKVEGQSMYSTLHDRDSIILWELGSKPSQFDVIVYEYAEAVFHVKRIIGLPGQNIRYENDQLYIDGLAVAEPFLKLHQQQPVMNSYWDIDSRLFTENFVLQDICDHNGFTNCEVIPEGYFLVLGDNRPESWDSRHVGLIREDQLKGTAVWVQWPLSRFGPIQ